MAMLEDLSRKLYGCLLSSSRHARDNCVMYDASLNLGRRWNEIEVKSIRKGSKSCDFNSLLNI